MNSSNNNFLEISELANTFPKCLFGKGIGKIQDLIAKYKPVDLASGYPDYDDVVKDELKRALASTQHPGEPTRNNQYTRPMGHPELVNELAGLYSGIMGRNIDAMEEVLVTIGAQGSLHCIMKAIVNPGDEVIIIEPFFVPFNAFVISCGATPRFVRLRMKPGGKRAEDFEFDKDELKQTFNDKTKAIIVNTPHNPTGKVFTKEEISFIADLCKEHNCLYISDEVYDWIQYSPSEGVRAASLPGMWERTVTIGSAGKTFNVTGWRVGWTIGPSYLVSAAHKIHVSIVFSAPTPNQIALASAFREERKKLFTSESYWYRLVETLRGRRDRLYQMLREAGFRPIMPQGGYFMMADASFLQDDSRVEGSESIEFDQRISEWLIEEMGIVAFPASAFYSQYSKMSCDKFLRFCFIKSEETFDAADERFQVIKKNI